MKRNEETEEELPTEVQRNIPANGLRHIGSHALQSSGDQAVNASTILPWLFGVLGVPAGLTGLLVPIRESGSMLPQAFLTPIVTRVRYRKWVFVAGALIQAAAVAAMAATAAFASGLTAGIVIIVALAIFSLGRCLGSISSKDVQGRTIPKGERGQINGLSTVVSGIVAITLGLAIRWTGGDTLTPGQFAAVLALGALCWVGVALVYSRMVEPADEDHDDDHHDSPLKTTVHLLRDDVPFRHFVIARSLLLVSSLSPPFIVALSIQAGSTGLTGLAGFVIASGIASLIGGSLFGRWADRSSHTLMSVGAAVASAVVVILIALTVVPNFSGDSGWASFVFIAAYFLVTLMHKGVRVGRKTYVVDMAEGDQRTEYVAVSNTAMGVILLVVGAISSALAGLGTGWALGFLALMGLAGVIASHRLPDVSQG